MAKYWVPSPALPNPKPKHKSGEIVLCSKFSLGSDSVSSLFLSATLLWLTHLVQALLASWLLHQTSGVVLPHWLFPLPGVDFIQTSVPNEVFFIHPM
jgi:hypothetical protein